jgi:predicted RNase H-like HicB family nuclease
VVFSFAKGQSRAVQAPGKAGASYGSDARQQGSVKVRRSKYPETSGVEMTKRYLVVYAKCKGSNFSGHAPDVPGCVSAGDTIEEMNTMMREALEFHFEGILEDGDTIPEPKTMNVDIKSEDFEDVDYFIVRQLEVKVPVLKQVSQTVRAA